MGAYHLRNTNAEEVEVSHACELEDQLFRNEIPDGVSGSSNCIWDVGVASPRIQKRRVVANPQWNMAPIRFGQCLPSQDQFNNDSLVKPRESEH